MKEIINIERADELIGKFLAGNINAAELEELKNWIAWNKNNADYFKQEYLVWKSISIAELNSTVIDQAYNKLLGNIDYKPVLEQNLPVTKLIRPILKWAAVILISAGLGSFLTFIMPHKEKKSIALNEIIVPLGSRSRVILPDKSEVWLNAGSKLSYMADYGIKLREVTLEGEGYFKVAKMTSKAFIVHTSRANIKALGTEFNVKAYPEENTIETILVEGSVLVNKVTDVHDSKNKNLGNIILKPGQKVLIYKDQDLLNPSAQISKGEKKQASNDTDTKSELNPVQSNTEIETSWKDQNWVIQGENLKELSQMLGRRYNVHIIIKNDELGNYKFSGIIQNETLEQLFELIKLTTPVSYKIKKGEVELDLNNSLKEKYQKAYH